MTTPPTSFPAVNTLLGKLLSNMQGVLGENFVGMYLYGSLASGDFDARRSDVDFVVVTARELSHETVFALEKMHDDLASSGLDLATKLEGAYLPQADIRRHTSSETRYPTLNEGNFYLGKLGSDWVIQRHILRENPVVVAGVSPRTLIDPVSPAALRQAVRDVLNEWWLPLLETPARLHADDYQAFAVLSMCRTLFTLQTGTVASKPVSARWAREQLGEHWAALITEALNWHYGKRLDKLDETLEFIKFTLEQANQ